MGIMGALAAARDGIPVADLNRRAATHLLNRVAYGPRPGDIDALLGKGLESYLNEQLSPGADPDLDARLQPFASLKWTAREAWDFYQIDIRTQNEPAATRTAYIPELNSQQRTAQIVRGAHAKFQLREVMTWFWFNHFNVNLPDDFVRYAAHDYEREIRSRALGRFKDLLVATAHHPAMMSYLDNYLSTISRFDRNGRLTSGVNENYGRELLELHTVGVDAGYDQKDVYNAALVLTGWGLAREPNPNGNGTRNWPAFAFTTANHDPQATEIFGLKIPAGLQKQSGDQLLDFLAGHEATADFISTKLVRHFVHDDPPRSLVKRCASTFLETDGDIAAVLKTIFGSKEFWDEAFGPGKYRNPYQYVVGTLRAAGAEVTNPRPLITMLTNMGQPQYGCIPPTGWSDKGREWENPSSHLNRMSFALELVSAANTTPFQGVNVDLGRLLRGAGVDLTRASDVAQFVNSAVFGNRLSAETMAAATAVTSGSVSLANRVVGLLLAGPEAQGR
jgi:uncharacterized protein (DUF1800 family)